MRRIGSRDPRSVVFQLSEFREQIAIRTRVALTEDDRVGIQTGQRCRKLEREVKVHLTSGHAYLAIAATDGVNRELADMRISATSDRWIHNVAPVIKMGIEVHAHLQCKGGCAGAEVQDADRRYLRGCEVYVDAARRRVELASVGCIRELLDRRGKWLEWDRHAYVVVRDPKLFRPSVGGQ